MTSLQISTVFRPLMGDRVDGPIGKAIDVIAIIATLFGVAVSLGLGTLQIDAGLGEALGLFAYLEQNPLFFCSRRSR